MEPLQNIQTIPHNEILVLKNENKEGNVNLASFSLPRQFQKTFPYLTAYILLGWSLGGVIVAVNLLSDLIGLPWITIDGNSTTTIDIEFLKVIGMFFVFRYVIQKQLLPHLKP